MQDNTGTEPAASSILKTKVQGGVEKICSELRLDQFVKTRSIELSHYLDPPQSADNLAEGIPESLANAVACALVSIAHEEAFRMRRVAKHLPDRIIGGLFGLSSSTVVYNKRLIRAEITKKVISENKKTPRKIRTLR